MQGKNRPTSDPVYRCLVPHFMTLIFPRMPHSRTTPHGAAPSSCHWSGWRLNTLDGLITKTWNRLQSLLVWWMKHFSEVTTSVLLTLLSLSHTTVFSNSSPHSPTIFISTQCAETFISLSADQLSSTPSQGIFIRSQKTQISGAQYHTARRSHTRLILDPLPRERTFPVADCLE